MASTKKKIRIAKFAAGLLAGKTQRESALDAGVPLGPGTDVTASHLVREPEVQQTLEAALRELKADERFVAKQLKTGAERKPSSLQLEYLDRITDFLGHDRKANAPANINILSVITGAGLVDAKGQSIDAGKLAQS